MINANHKTFDDLVFEDHGNVSNAVQSRLDLGNNLEISVVSMKGESSGFGNLYGDASKGTYEVGVFHHGKMVPLSSYDDVIGWQTESEITVLMLNAQAYPIAWHDGLREKKAKVHAELELD